MRAFRLLRENEIECRIAEINKKGSGLTLLLYKTARTDAALLDETYGYSKWQNDFKAVGDKVYGGIGIRFGDEWIWRWDCGSESNVDAEKGQASDAFKRAGFKWGIGTELYTAPRIFISSDKCNIKEVNGKFRCYDEFSVKEISYDEQENINGLAIAIGGMTVYEFRAGERSRAAGKTNAQEKDISFRCADCGEVLKPVKTKDREISVRQWAEGTTSEFGRPVCLSCRKKLVAMNENTD